MNREEKPRSTFTRLKQFCLLGGFSVAAFTTLAQPVNDDFANRISMPGNGASITGSLASATSEPGEPFVADVSSGQTAWWTWTAPANGIATISTSGTGFNPLLAVYLGNDLNQLSLVASNNYLACYDDPRCGCHWRVRGLTTFHAQKGASYSLALDSALYANTSWIYQSNTSTDQFGNILYGMGQWLPMLTTNTLPGGDLQLGLQFAPAPPNDDFESRVTLSGARRRLAVSNEGATREPGEPSPTGNAGGSSVWYSWKAPVSGRVVLATSEVPPYSPPSWSGGSSASWDKYIIIMPVGGPPLCINEHDPNPPPEFFPVYSAYTGSTLAALVSANGVPVDLDAFPHAVEFDVVRGHTYQIAVDGNGGATGTSPLFLSTTTPASNDDFRRRITTHGLSVIASGFNAGATHEPDEPSPVAGSSGKTVWWSWRAPVTGMVSVELTGDHPFPVAVFTGSELATLQLVAVIDSRTAGAWSNTFMAEAGRRYQIALSDDAGRTGQFKLHLQAPVVELALLAEYRASSRTSLLRYTGCTAGQVVLLQRWNTRDGGRWENFHRAVARGDTVSFSARPAPTDGSPCRAIVVDFVGR